MHLYVTLSQYSTTRVHQLAVADPQGGLEAVLHHRACPAGKVTSSCYAYEPDRPLFTQWLTGFVQLDTAALVAFLRAQDDRVVKVWTCTHLCVGGTSAPLDEVSAS